MASTTSLKSSDPRLLAQRKLLVEFVESQPLFQHGAYAPWTAPSKKKGLSVALAASELLPGTVGLFAANRKKPIPPKVFIAAYTGVLMWTELFEQFTALYHCPTAVALPVLDYEVDDQLAEKMQLNRDYSWLEENRWQVTMLLVGDPTTPAAIINSPCNLIDSDGEKIDANCKLRSCKLGDVGLYMQKKGKKVTADDFRQQSLARHQQVTISSEIVYICRDNLPCEGDAELLTDYDGTESEEAGAEQSFWAYAATDYCESCFCKARVRDVLLSCAELGCTRRRHERCCPRILSPGRWYCDAHFPSRATFQPTIVTLPVVLNDTPPSRKATPGPATFSPLIVFPVSILTDTPPSQSTTPLLPQPRLNQLVPSSLSARLDSSAVSLIPSSSSALLPITFDLQDHAAARLLASSNQPVRRHSSYARAIPSDVPCTISDESSTDEEEQAMQPITKRTTARRRKVTTNESEESAGDGNYTPDEEDEPLSSESDSEPQRSATVLVSPPPSRSTSLAGTAGLVPPSARISSPVSAKSQSSRRFGHLSFHKPKRVHQIEELTEEGKQAIRLVWLSFEPDIKKVPGGKKCKWYVWSSGEVKTQREKDKEEKWFHKLNRNCTQINKCCGSRLVNPSMPISVATILSSPSHLLTYHLGIMQSCRWDKGIFADRYKEALKSHQPQMQADGTTAARHVWNGLSLCSGCLSCVYMSSRANSYRRLSPTPMEEAIIDEQDAKHSKASDLSEALLEFSREVGQSLPTAEGSRGGTVQNYVLPYRTQLDCREAFRLWYENRNGSSWKVSRHRFADAKDNLLIDRKVSINIKKRKSLATCDDCLKFGNQVAEAKKSNIAIALNNARLTFKNHLCEAREQRELFDSKKELAIRAPWLLNVCTADGMDTAKTHLPHSSQMTKSANAEKYLPLRVFGAYYFGAPIPCIAITSFDDVLNKGGAASVTNFERLINLEYTSMDPTNIDVKVGNTCNKNGVAADPPVLVIPERDRPPLVAMPVPMDESEGKEAVASELPVADGYEAFWKDDIDDHPVRKPASFLWPEGWHVTFDNTFGDCKNTATFRFFGALVAIGVFMYITVSTLLVGHTHDIVDQMFSVWSMRLGKVDAPTLRSMHRMFREKYTSKIYELEKLIHQLKHKSAAGDKHDAEPAEDVSPLIAERLVYLAKEFGVQPETILAEYSINVDSWCLKNGATQQIKGLGDVHCFYIVKEMVEYTDEATGANRSKECVMMYQRAMAKSHFDSGVIHNYPDVRFGPWTSRCVLVECDEPWLQTDPLFFPAKPVDVSGVKLCIQDHIANGSMTLAEKNEFEILLDKFSANFQNVKSKCEDCARFVGDIVRIGTISRKHDATDADLEVANQKTQAKSQHKGNLKTHLADSSLAHKHNVAVGWWTKWIERVQKVIRPYYEWRNLVAKSSDLAMVNDRAGRSVHPTSLATTNYLNTSEKPIVTWTQRRLLQGFPKKKDIIIARGNQWYHPCWVGSIVKIGQPGDSTSMELAMINEEEDCDADEDSYRPQSKKRARTSSASFSASHPAASSSTYVASLSNTEGSTAQSTSSRRTRSNAASSSSFVAAATSSSSNSAASSSSSFAAAAASSSSSSSATFAPSSMVPAASYSARRRGKRRSEEGPHDDGPVQYYVEWRTWQATGIFKDIELEGPWIEAMKASGSLDAWRDAIKKWKFLQAIAIHSEDSAETRINQLKKLSSELKLTEGTELEWNINGVDQYGFPCPDWPWLHSFNPLPSAHIDHLRTVQYVTQAQSPDNCSWLTFDQLIYYGDRQSVLTAKHQLTQAAFEQVKRDLTQSDATQTQPAILSTDPVPSLDTELDEDNTPLALLQSRK